MRHTNGISFVYFDIGGVILRWKAVFSAIAVKHGKTVQEVEEVFGKHDQLANYGSIQPEALWKLMKKDLSITDTSDMGFAAFMIDTFTPITETHEFLKWIISHYRIGLLTNIYHGVFALCKNRGLIPDLPYEAVIQSCDVKMAKPQKEIYEYAQKKAGVSASSILFVDDLQGNIDASMLAGWHGTLFDTDNPQRSLDTINRILHTA